MAYQLAVDVGTTFTAAAVSSGSAAVMVGLGNRALQVPSLVYFETDGALLIGEAADFRGRGDPNGLVREFKRRLGDSVPILIRGTPYSPQALTAALLDWVITQVTERQGAAPAHVVLTYPANWTEFKLDIFRQVETLADVASMSLFPEPAAAAAQYAATRDVADGVPICVYDLGGGTFDVCVLLPENGTFQVLGRPGGIEHLGGVDFDEAIFRHALEVVGLSEGGVDASDSRAVAMWERLRRDCVEAKEALSTQTEVVIPVELGSTHGTARLVRSELEEMIRAPLEQTLVATRRALRAASIDSSDIGTFVLIGGSSRIPLVAEILIDAFGRPVGRNTHPKHDVALGAALGALPAAPLTTRRTKPPRFEPAAPSAPSIETPVTTDTRTSPGNTVGADVSASSSPASDLDADETRAKSGQLSSTGTAEEESFRKPSITHDMIHWHPAGMAGLLPGTSDREPPDKTEPRSEPDADRPGNGTPKPSSQSEDPGPSDARVPLRTLGSGDALDSVASDDRGGSDHQPTPRNRPSTAGTGNRAMSEHKDEVGRQTRTKNAGRSSGLSKKWVWRLAFALLIAVTVSVPAVLVILSTGGSGDPNPNANPSPLSSTQRTLYSDLLAHIPNEKQNCDRLTPPSGVLAEAKCLSGTYDLYRSYDDSSSAAVLGANDGDCTTAPPANAEYYRQVAGPPQAVLACYATSSNSGFIEWAVGPVAATFLYECCSGQDYATVYRTAMTALEHTV